MKGPLHVESSMVPSGEIFEIVGLIDKLKELNNKNLISEETMVMLPLSLIRINNKEGKIFVLRVEQDHLIENFDENQDAVLNVNSIHIYSTYGMPSYAEITIRPVSACKSNVDCNDGDSCAKGICDISTGKCYNDESCEY